MASSQYGGGAGGKFQKRSRRAAPSPYDRPQSAIRRPNMNPNLNSNSSWFSKIVDPASKLIAKGASMFFASVFQKRLGAPITIPEENHFGHEAPGDVANLQNPLDVAPESGGNIMDNATSDSKTNGTLDTSLNAADDCETKKEPTSSLNGVFDIEQLLKQKTFTRAEFDRLSSLLRSRTIEPKSTLEGAVSTEHEKEIQQSIIEPSTSQPLRGEKGEGIFSEQHNENKSSTLQCNNTNLAVNFHIPDQTGVSPEQIAREYMGYRTPKPSHSTLGVGSQKSESPNFPIVPFSNKSRMPLLASRNYSSISSIHEHPQNSYMTPRPRGRSAVYKNSRSPYFRASLGSNSRDGLAYASTSSPFISSTDTHSSNKQAAKRGRSVLENNIELHDPMRRTRQKSSLISQGQGESSVGLVSRGLDNRTPTNLFHVPTKSTEMALKIIQQLDKLEASPREKPCEKKGSADGDMASNSPTLKLVNSLSPKKDKLKENSQPDTVSEVKSDAVISSSAATPSVKEAAVQTAKDQASPELDACKNSSNIASVISATEKKKSTDKPLSSSFKSGMPSSSILKIKDDAKEASIKLATKKRVEFSIPISTSKSSPERKETSVLNSSQEGSLSRTPPTKLESSDNDKQIKRKSDSSQINGASTSTSSPISVSFGSPVSFIANSSASKVSFGTLAEPNISKVTPTSEISKQEPDIKTSVAPSFTMNSSAPQETSNASSTTKNSGNGNFLFSASGTQSSGFGFTSQATQPTASSNPSLVFGFTSQATQPIASSNPSPVFGFNSQATQATASSNQSSVSGFTSQATQPTASSNPSPVFGFNSQATQATASSNQSSVSGFTSQATQPTASSNPSPVFGFNSQATQATASSNQSSVSGFTSQATQPTFGLNNNNSNTPNFTTSTATSLFSSSSQPTSSMFSSSFASKPSFSFTSAAASPPPSQPVFGFSKQAPNSPGSDGMKVDDSTTNNNVQATPIFGSNSQFTPSATEAGSQPVFQFGGNGNNSTAPQNSSSFQTPGNFQFSANESFSLGSGGAGGGDKAGRRIIKVRRDKHKKK